MVYHAFEPPVIVFDDLKMLNYEMVYDGLDCEDIQVMIDKIAKYHALSMILLDKVRSDIL